MKKNGFRKQYSCLLGFILCASFNIFGQVKPYFTFNKSSQHPMLVINSSNDFNKSNIYFEPPPWVVQGGYHYYIFSTNHSISFSFRVGIEKLSSRYLDFSPNPFFNRNYGPFDLASPQNWWYGDKDPATLDNNYEQWKRSYHGIFSAHAIHDPSNGNIIIGYAHGENKNERKNNYTFNNTVNDYTACYSEYNANQQYEECWKAYFGFLNITWTQNTAANDWGNAFYIDNGPCVWPSNGYVNSDNSQASNGLRHPSSIIHNNEIYIFYGDNSNGEEGRKRGIKVAKANVSESTNPLAYKVYYNGNWNPSLPTGFTKENMENFFNVKGPKATNILNVTDKPVRFSVAKIKNTPYFLGAESYIDNDDLHKIALRISDNLIDWSDRMHNIDASSWNDSWYKYPIFLNLEGTSNTEINKDGFLLIGVQSSQSIYRMLCSINLCPENISKSGSIQEKLSASNNITISNATITQTIDVRAGNSITFLPGTEISAGNYTIGICDNDKMIMSNKDEDGLEINPFNDKTNKNTNHSISIYPNPTNGQFNVNIDSDFEGVIELEIINLMGKSILKNTDNKNNYSFDLSNFPKGIYLLKTKIASKLTSQKIIYQ